MRGIKARLHEARVRKESGTRRKNKKNGRACGRDDLEKFLASATLGCVRVWLGCKMLLGHYCVQDI